MRRRKIGVLCVFVVALTGCDQGDYPVFCAVPVGDSPVRGLESAWVTVVVFSDFQCPYCGQAATTLDQLEREYADDALRIVFKHLPLSFHEHALPAAIAAECAHEQGRFWSMHDILFDRQDALEDASLVTYAEAAGLDLETWETCRASQAPRDRIEADLALAESSKVPATPTFFINGSPRVGSHPLDELVDAVDDALEDALSSGVLQLDYYESLTRLECE